MKYNEMNTPRFFKPTAPSYADDKLKEFPILF